MLVSAQPSLNLGELWENATNKANCEILSNMDLTLYIVTEYNHLTNLTKDNIKSTRFL